MNHKTAILAALAAGVVAQQATAAVKISEVVFNEAGSAFSGEWIEIYNTGDSAVDLSNYKIGDEETSGGTGATEALFQFPAGSSINPGEVQIVASFASRFIEVYGFAPTYEAGSSVAADSWVDDVSVPNMSVYAAWDSDGAKLNMSNTNDQAVLVDPTDTIIDAASWGQSTFAFDPALGSAADGQSYERINALVDTDTAADWQVGTAPANATWAAASNSTPGTVTIPEPASLSLLALGALAMGRRRR